MAKKQKNLSPGKMFFFVWIIVLAISYTVLKYYIANAWILLFTSTNIATFIIFGLDKFQSRFAGRRVPEKILYLTSFLGGPIGAVAAMKMFRHKTQKQNFQLILAVLILIQIGISAYILYYL